MYHLKSQQLADEKEWVYDVNCNTFWYVIVLYPSDILRTVGIWRLSHSHMEGINKSKYFILCKFDSGQYLYW